MPAKFSQRETADRQDEILANAATVFARKGYEATTVRELEEATGLTRGGIFFHFPSKRALYFAALRRSTTSGGPPVSRAMRAADSAAEAVLAMFWAVRAWHREHPEAMAFFNQIALHKADEPDIADLDALINESMESFITAINHELQEQGIFNPDVDADTITEVLHHLLDHLIEEAMPLDDAEAEALVSPILQLVVKGLAPREVRASG